jgi:hypothetical protein
MVERRWRRCADSRQRVGAIDRLDSAPLPTTASASSATVVPGSSTIARRMPCTTAGARLPESTFSPTDNAVTGPTAARITPVQAQLIGPLRLIPEVSKRNICWPCATTAGSNASGERPHHAGCDHNTLASDPRRRVAVQVTSPTRLSD